MTQETINALADLWGLTLKEKDLFESVIFACESEEEIDQIFSQGIGKVRETIKIIAGTR